MNGETVAVKNILQKDDLILRKKMGFNREVKMMCFEDQKSVIFSQSVQSLEMLCIYYRSQ